MCYLALSFRKRVCLVPNVDHGDTPLDVYEWVFGFFDEIDLPLLLVRDG